LFSYAMFIILMLLGFTQTLQNSTTSIIILYFAIFFFVVWVILRWVD